MKTNTRTAAAVQKRANAALEDALVICYPDADRSGYIVKMTVTRTDGSEAVSREWFGAYLLAEDLAALVIKRAAKLR